MMSLHGVAGGLLKRLQNPTPKFVLEICLSVGTDMYRPKRICLLAVTYLCVGFSFWTVLKNINKKHPFMPT
jgi:hypothetical protein